jgi:Amt family ammonium transporter
LKVSEEDEDLGVDISECGLDAYPEFTKSSSTGPSVYPK